MDQSTTTRLQLEGWEVIAVEDTATGWQVTVEAPRPPQCPHCGHARLHRHDPCPAQGVPPLGIGLRPDLYTNAARRPPGRDLAAALRRGVSARPDRCSASIVGSLVVNCNRWRGINRWHTPKAIQTLASTIIRALGVRGR